MVKHLKTVRNCTGCMACVNACDLNCISMIRHDNGFSYPHIDKNKCVSCGKCVQVCNRTIDSNAFPQKAFACYNLDKNCQLESSSGGIFTLLAKKILNSNGVVYGAAFDEKYSVIHRRVENESELKALLGSKYVQSDIGYVYKLVKKDLIANRYVLFSGTPCQIFGLKSLLGKSYDKLYTVEVICHGVPSPGVWEKYLSEVRDDLMERIEKVNFRDKSTGWHRFSLGIYTENKKKVEACNENIYMKLFLGNHILRPSCYHCDYTKMNRNADITLGDCWGNEFICPELSDDGGISAVILNTKLGINLFEEIKDQLVLQEVSYASIIRVNKSFLTSPSKTATSKRIDKLISISHDKWSSELNSIDKFRFAMRRAYNKLTIELILKYNKSIEM